MGIASSASTSNDLPVFTGMTLDRVSVQRKDPEWVGRLLQDLGSRSVLARHDGVALAPDTDPPSLLRAPLRAVAPEEPILLGLDEDGIALFGADIEGDEEPDVRVVSLRDAGSVLPPAEAGLAAYVVAMLNWHRRHHFCANCGAPTAVAEAGYSRHCPRCGAHHFPRTDPVVIMTVEHEGRLLLGRRSGWPEGRMSVLAGFVSPGESAEEAVVREVQEESGIVARDPVFVTSQPWPFPASLMLGFHAVSDGGDPRATDDELAEVGWYELDRVRAVIRGEDAGFQLPPGVSVARLLIERWAAPGGGGGPAA